MALLGAIIAGGMSRRFGSDKAMARIDGVALLDHVHAALKAQVDDVVLCGRTWLDWSAIQDVPGAGLGPLGGMAAALSYASQNGFDAVLTVPVDTYPLPVDLCRLLGAGPACFADQYLIGLWPSSIYTTLHAHLVSGHRSVRSWISASQCRLVDGENLSWRNINSVTDLPEGQDGCAIIERRGSDWAAG